MKLSNEEAKELLYSIETTNMKPFIIPEDVIVFSSLNKPVKIVMEGKHLINTNEQGEGYVLFGIEDIIEKNIGYWSVEKEKEN